MSLFTFINGNLICKKYPIFGNIKFMLVKFVFLTFNVFKIVIIYS